MLHDGRWVRGWLRHRHRTPEGWRGVVRYTAGVGQTYEQARPYSELRPGGARWTSPEARV